MGGGDFVDRKMAVISKHRERELFYFHSNRNEALLSVTLRDRQGNIFYADLRIGKIERIMGKKFIARFKIEGDINAWIVPVNDILVASDDGDNFADIKTFGIDPAKGKFNGWYSCHMYFGRITAQFSDLEL